MDARYGAGRNRVWGWCMKHGLEPFLVIAMLAISFVLRETVELDAKYIVVGASLLALGYTGHLIVQYFQGAAVKRQFPWLYSYTSGSKQALSQIERCAARDTTVYLISPDLHNDARDAHTQSIVASNLSKNVRYKYISRDDNDESSLNIAKVMEDFSSFSDLISVYAINEVFSLMPIANVLLLSHENTGRRVFIELPVFEPGSKTRRRWVETDPLIALQWERRILQMLEGKQPLKNPYKAPQTKSALSQNAISTRSDQPIQDST
jgi:hypothetical protein